MQERWGTLRRLLAAAFTPAEKSKPFTQQTRRFALSWTWEHPLSPYGSLKSQSFPVLPPTLSQGCTFSASALGCARRGWEFAGGAGSVLCTQMSALASDVGAATHTLSTSWVRSPVSLWPPSQLRAAPFMPGAPPNTVCRATRSFWNPLRTWQPGNGSPVVTLSTQGVSAGAGTLPQAICFCTDVLTSLPCSSLSTHSVDV